MLAKEIAEYLDMQNIGVWDESGNTGNIFACKMPEKPDTAIAIYPRPGSPADGALKYDNPGIQIIVRAPGDPEVGERIATDAYNALHGFHGGVFSAGGTHIVSCLGMQSGPNHIGRDENGRHEYSLNFSLTVSNEDRRN